MNIETKIVRYVVELLYLPITFTLINKYAVTFPGANYVFRRFFFRVLWSFVLFFKF